VKSATQHARGKSGQDDLFDLPSEARPSGEPAEAPAAAAPRADAAPAETVRPAEDVRVGAQRAPAPAGTTAARHLRRDMWIAFAALAAANVAVLSVGLTTRSAPEPEPAHPALDLSAGAPDPLEAHAAPAPAPVSPLVSAQALLREGKEDLEAGRFAAARARMGRVLLAIDAVEPARREEVRAEARLLVARCLQAEADRERNAQR
jgi:hypothetical protein